MSFMKSNDGKELYVDCMCGCDDGIRIRIDKDDDNLYMIAILTNGNWYRDQNDNILMCIGRKLKKIMAIIRNKDFYYSEIIMTEKDFNEFKEHINSI